MGERPLGVVPTSSFLGTASNSGAGGFVNSAVMRVSGIVPDKIMERPGAVRLAALWIVLLQHDSQSCRQNHSHLYRPQTKFAKVMFSQVSVCPQEGCLPHCMLGYTPQTRGRHPPVQCMLGYGQQAGGTHPTGMHSCCLVKFLCIGCQWEPPGGMVSREHSCWQQAIWRLCELCC